MCSRVKMADTLIQNAKREKKWHFVSKIVLAMKEKYSTDKEKRLKLQPDCGSLAKLLRSLEQFIYSINQ